MTPINYYLILGVPREASRNQIRRAYRTLSRRYHPDMTPEGEHEKFVQLREAYETLRDPERRAAYNHEMEQAASQPPQGPHRAVDWPEPISPLRSYATHSPSVEEITDHFARNFTGRAVPKSRPVKDLNIEVLLSPAQAARGTVVPLEIPVYRACLLCQGSGRTGHYICDRCDGQGLTLDPARVDVVVSPGTRDGTVVPVSLRGLGVRNMLLRVHLRIPGGATFL